MYKNDGEAQDLPGNVSKVNLQLQLFHFTPLTWATVGYWSFLQLLQSTFPGMKGDIL